MKKTIHVHHPHAAQLTLRGAGALGEWQEAHAPTQVQGEHATFEVEIPTADNWVEFKPILAHNQWELGPNHALTPMTGVVDLYPTFERGRGRIETTFPQFYSSTLNNHRDIKVYYPPGYDENPEKKYPVIYMMDGQNVFESTGYDMPHSWRAEETLDRLIDEGKIPPAIVVAVHHQGPERIAEFSPVEDPKYPGSGAGDKFLTFLIDELKPEVDRRIRTHSASDNTYMIGSSMGGLISLCAAMQRPDFVQKIAALSPAAWWGNNWHARQLLNGQLNVNALQRLWIDFGDYSRDAGRGTSALIESLKTRGLRDGSEQFQTWVSPEAEHSEQEWARRLPMVLEFLFR